jgi:hypothetical protein
MKTSCQDCNILEGGIYTNHFVDELVMHHELYVFGVAHDASIIMIAELKSKLFQLYCVLCVGYAHLSKEEVTILVGFRCNQTTSTLHEMVHCGQPNTAVSVPSLVQNSVLWVTKQNARLYPSWLLAIVPVEPRTTWPNHLHRDPPMSPHSPVKKKKK